MKFEFGDLYKFYVSVSVVLISLAIVTPWLFLREPFDLFTTVDELAELTQPAQETIERRQKLTLTAIKVVPWLSASSLITGIFLGSFGLWRWYENQKISDANMRIDLELSKLKLRDASPREIAMQISSETTEEIDVDEFTNDFSVSEADVLESIKLERNLAKRLSSIFSSQYDVQLQKIISNDFIDILLLGKNRFSKDYILDIRYRPRGFSYSWLKESALKIRQISGLYAQIENRNPNTIIVIFSNAEIIEKATSYFDWEKLREELPRLRRSKHRIALLTPEEITTLNDSELTERLYLSV